MEKEFIAPESVDLAATKAGIELLHKNKWLRLKAEQYPEDTPIDSALFSMIMGGTYRLDRPRAQQALRYLKEDGYLKFVRAQAA